MIRKSFVIFVVPAVFFLDRILKILVIHRYNEGAGFAVWPGVFHVTRVNNTGAAFGILKGSGVFLTAFSGVSVLLLAAYWARQLASSPKTSSPAFAWALVIGGALGNLYDRLFYGYVIDFLDFRVWPVFNLADASISVGVFWIVARFLSRRGVLARN